MGNSRKYPYHTTDSFLEFLGQGGTLNWNSKGMGDTYKWNSEGMGEVKSGIYTGDRQECIPWKRFFMAVLNQFVNGAQTDDLAVEAECKTSIDRQACVHFH